MPSPLPRKKKKIPLLLDDTEPERLIAATRIERERLMLLLMLLCGLRVSEVARLNVEDLDFRHKGITVRDSKSGDRLCPMQKDMVRPLRGYVAARKTGPLFVSPRTGTHYTKRALQKMIKRVAVAAGIADALTSSRVRCHALRHQFCCRLLDAGVAIHVARDLMGHASLASTNEYANCNPDRLREAIDRPYQR